MSDDEYYANSPYDDYDDLLWDDGASQDIAGDLAEHTLHSPVWQDDPGYELLQGFSDWEYYSDDYYDDDPSLLKINPQDGSPLAKAKQTGPQSTSAKRGRKRKLAETKDIPPLDLDERSTLKDCIRGTVWAERKPVALRTYQEGESERIALLKGWKDVSKNASLIKDVKPKIFGRGQLQQDESWANDLSLEDMGLVTARGRTAPDTEKANAEAGDADDEDEAEIYDDEAELITMQADGVWDGENNDALVANGDDYEPRKRRKRTGSKLRTLLSQTTTLAKSSDEDEAPESGCTQEELGHSGMSDTGLVVLEDEKRRTGTPALASVRSKKRAASPSGDEADRQVNKSTVSSRAKRVASSKLSTKEAPQRENVPPMPSKRETRNRKKG